MGKEELSQDQANVSGSEQEGVIAALQIAQQFWQTDLKHGLALSEEAYILAVRANWPEKVIDALLLKSGYESGLQRYDDASRTLSNALEIAQRIGDRDGEGYILSNIGKSYFDQGEYAKCTSYYMGALQCAKETHNKTAQSSIACDIALLYLDLKDTDRSLSFYTEALELTHDMPITSSGRRIYIQAIIGIGNVYAYLKGFDKALEYYHRGLVLVEQYNSWFLEAPLLENLGQTHGYLGEYDIAKDYLYRALAMRREHDYTSGLITALLYLGQILIREQKGEEALPHLLEALELVPHVQMRDSYELHLALWECYKQLGDYANALKHYELFHSLKEKILLQEAGRETQRLAIVYEVEKVRYEKELADKEKEIYHLKNVELGSLLQKLKLLNKRLTRLNREKDEIIGIVAHDLKSPLGGIRVVTSMMEVYHGRMPEEEKTRRLVNIRITSERMLGVVDQLLEVQAIETGTAHKKEELVDVSGIIDLLLEQYREAAEQKSLRFHRECRGYTQIYGSRAAVVQVFDNLISNAMKFSPPDRNIYIRILERRKKLIIEVQDEGPGISKGEKRQLFRKFSRLNARPTAAESSTGLGLWIARRAVKSLKGTIRCTSEQMQGTTFRVILPLGQCTP